MTIGTALRQGTELLEDGHVAAPRLTAEVLLAFALRRDRVFLYSHSEEELVETAWIHYGRYLHERLGGKPTQYITKTQEFYGRDFEVRPGVLIPRPETELVVAEVLQRTKSGASVLDVGCGSGAIAITLALESHGRIFATDLSADALAIAARNSERLRATVRFAACDLLTGIRARSLDVVVSNPPYVSERDKEGLQREVREWEPEIALFAGPTGTEMYERIVADAARVLRPGGWLVLELGYRSLEAVQSMLGPDWAEVTTAVDLAGIPRVLCASYRP